LYSVIIIKVHVREKSQSQRKGTAFFRYVQIISKEKLEQFFVQLFITSPLA